LTWNLEDSVKTSAGTVASGCCGKGKPLVLAHGWPWSSYSWHRVIPELAEHYLVFWYDMPGYGQSEKTPKQRTGLDVQGQIFREMIDYWQLDRPMVVAHDFGGAATLRAHLLHGCEFSRYVLMNVVAMRPWGSEFFEHVGRHLTAFAGLPPHIHKAVVEAYIQGALVNKLDEADFEYFVESWLTDEGKESFYRQFAQADEKFTAEVEPFFSDIRCPVKIIWGQDDPWIPLTRGEALRDLVKPIAFNSLPRVGHLPQLEVPGQVLSELLSFLE
jgi:pimeloyl-ACP methyl ester carboxylesterase